MNKIESRNKILYIPKNKVKIDNLNNSHFKSPVQDCQKLDTSGSVVIIGANGTGKTRLGTWLDLKSPLWENSLRISAQKSLTMPESVNPGSIDKALNNLIYGYKDGNVSYKVSSKWQNEKSSTYFLSDFDKLMEYLFSEEMDANAKFTHQSRNSTKRLEPPLTKLAILKNIWESLLPHRELIIGGAKVETRIKGDSASLYNSSEMSDGERVIFYLIGACLSAPQNGTIIVDEPEIHIHKSLQYSLWKSLENERSDCLFVYITHDVDFASSQIDATKIWLKNFDGHGWEWQEIDKKEDFPDNLLYEIMGSRRKVIFVEGENGSHDISLYRILFPKHLIIPRGSCTTVINDIKTLRKLPSLHHLDIIGIIDRDRRVENEIYSLLKDGIYVLPVAEVENLFCTEEIVKYCCDLLSRDYNMDIEKIKNEIFKLFNSELENQLSMRVISEAKFKLNNLDEKGKSRDIIKEKFNDLIEDTNIDGLYDFFEKIFEKINNEKNYNELLKYYNRKSIKDKVANILEIKDLPSLVIRTASGENNGLILKKSLKKYFENIPGY